MPITTRSPACSMPWTPANCCKGLARILGAERAAGATVHTLADAEWETLWRQETPARYFGNGLWVIPHGDPAPSDARAVVRLDPGLAFGTGFASHHGAVSGMALIPGSRRAHGDRLWLWFRRSRVAAAILGASAAYAVDHDPQALEATRDNASSNGVENRVHVTAGPAAGRRAGRKTFSPIPFPTSPPASRNWSGPADTLRCRGFCRSRSADSSSATRPCSTWTSHANPTAGFLLSGQTQ